MLILFAAVLPVVILFCGLCVDVGLLQLKQLQMQSAADSAVLAAEIEAERGPGDWYTQAQQDAAVNGFTNGSNNTTVSLGVQPSSGSYAGRYDVFYANISQTVNTIFMGTLNGGTVTLSAQAQSLLTPCLYLTGTGALQTYPLDGYSGSLTSVTCPFNVNSGITTNYGATIAAEAINVAGSAASSANAGYLYPSPNYNVPSVTDPLTAIASPTFSSCSYTSYSKSNVSSLLTLSPGTYCKGITLTSDSNVVLNPGLYIITGGATWSNSTVSGSGVTLFFTKGGGGNDGKFIIENSSDITLTAPSDSSSGGIPAILVFTDRNWTPTSPQDFALEDSTIQADGIIYLPATGIYIWNCGNIIPSKYLGIEADNIYLGGTNVTLKNNYSNISTGNPFRTLTSLVQ